MDIANGNCPVANLNNECPGPSSHDQGCDAGYCPVDGGWTEWQHWGECTVACGEGKRVSRRYCTKPFPMHGGKKCQGEKIKEGKCEKLPPCPIHCLFSKWGSWGQCSVTCGNSPGAGTRTRCRHVMREAQHGGLECMGGKTEQTGCELCEKGVYGKKECISPCPVACVISEWTEWSGRCPKCYKPAAKKHISKIKRRRSRFVESDAEHGGEPCRSPDGKEVKMEHGLVEELKPCQADKDVPPCPAEREAPYWTSWTEWGPCTAKCGGERPRQEDQNVHNNVR